jgi:glycosyltransferase involved in cell wall biosynthesis
MNQSYAPFAKKSLFLVWSSPTYGSSRSRVFSEELGIEELHYVYAPIGRSPLSAPLRYVVQAVQTMRLLFRKRPKIVFIQSPPSFAVIFVYLYCALTGSVYIIDAHTKALLHPYFTRPLWLHRFLARKALATLVTGKYLQKMVQDWGGRAIVLKDPITTYPAAAYSLNGSFNVVVVNTFKSDEPLHLALEAASGLEGIEFYVTGKKSNADPQLLAQAPANVHFTDFLPDEQYYGLLSAGHAVMCLTSRDHTLQCGACEALSLEKPVITSDWPLLREYFHQGTVHVPNTPEGIRQGVREMQSNFDQYQLGIIELRRAQRREWERKIDELVYLFQESKSEQPDNIADRIL